MNKSPDAFRTISEVADWLDVPAHVLRFWESKFAAVKPIKRAGGRRYYRPADMALLGGIKKLLHDDGLTIKGVQKILQEQGISHVAALSQLTIDQIDDAISTVASPVPPISPDAIVQMVPEIKPTPAPATSQVAETQPPPIAPQPVAQQPAPETLPVQEQPAETATNTATDTVEEPADTPLEKASVELPSESETRVVVPQETAQDDVAALPSFLHRAAPASPPVAPEPAQDAPPVEETSPKAEPEIAAKSPAIPESKPASEPESPREPAPASPEPVFQARVIDAPDPAPEAEQPYSPGPLALLAKIDALSDKQARQITPLAKELYALLNRAGVASTA